jgi:hypothetical protein
VIEHVRSARTCCIDEHDVVHAQRIGRGVFFPRDGENPEPVEDAGTREFFRGKHRLFVDQRAICLEMQGSRRNARHLACEPE